MLSLGEITINLNFAVLSTVFLDIYIYTHFQHQQCTNERQKTEIIKEIMCIYYIMLLLKCLYFPLLS